jgi:hypothetical protein
VKFIREFFIYAHRVRDDNILELQGRSSMSDPTEAARRERLIEINSDATERESLEARYGEVWDTRDLARDFIVIGFSAPLVVVKRKEDEVRGSLEFQHQPRYYFNFHPH